MIRRLWSRRKRCPGAAPGSNTLTCLSFPYLSMSILSRRWWGRSTTQPGEESEWSRRVPLSAGVRRGGTVGVTPGPRSSDRRLRRSAARGGGRLGRTFVVAARGGGLVLGVVGSLAVVTATPGPAAAAPTAASCSFATAGSGTFARTLCWFDLSGYNATTAGSAAGQPMTVALPGGYSISFTLKVTGGAAAPNAFPTFSWAY